MRCTCAQVRCYDHNGMDLTRMSVAAIGDGATEGAPSRPAAGVFLGAYCLLMVTGGGRLSLDAFLKSKGLLYNMVRTRWPRPLTASSQKRAPSRLGRFCGRSFRGATSAAESLVHVEELVAYTHSALYVDRITHTAREVPSP